MKMLSNLKTIGAVALMLPLAANLALAGNPNPKIMPIKSTPYGMAYGQWGDAWWQWAMSIPADMNPVMDTTGEFAAVGQSGPVWFLAGSYGQVVVRTVTIPAGKALFFPIYDQCWINIPYLGDPPWSAEQEVWVRDFVAASVDAVSGPNDLACEIDGVPVADLLSYRSGTAPGEEFMVDLPVNDCWGLTAWGLPEPGTYGPSIQEGVYLMVAPLPAGRHTIRIVVAGFLDVTYHLTVQK